MKKSIISLLITLTLVFNALPFLSFSANAAVSAQIDFSQGKYVSAEKAILNAWDNYDKKVVIYNYKILLSEANEFLNAVCDRNNEYFFVSINSYSSSGNYIYSVSFEYYWETDEIEQKREEFNQKADSILKSIPNSLSNAEKLLYLHDYIAKNNKYDMRAYTEEGVTDIERNAYGCIVNELSVCQGISEAFMYLCKQIGIEAYPVTSTQMCHEWVMVKLNDNYYHIDITWDTIIISYNDGDQMQPCGDITHKYFLLSDDELDALDSSNDSLSDSQKHDKTEWSAPFEATDDTTFANSYWKNTEDQINFINNKAYFIKDNCLFEYDCLSETSQSIITFDNKTWNAQNGKKYVWNASGAKSTANETENIFYIISDEIFSYNVNKGTIKKVFSGQTSGYIYSLNFKDNYIEYTVRDVTSDGKSSFTDKSLMLLLGDIDYSGSIDSIDILEMRKFLANESSRIEADSYFADVNNDDIISIKDVLALRKKLAEL
ncbi:MAG: dockerin type I domain-containing protein [Acutalibacteraceae bacterium]